jgi:hypothetical protein
MREESEKRTSASVASASARTVELVLSMSIPSRTLGPTRSPIETNRIAGVIGDPDTGFETAATAISASATAMTSLQAMFIERLLCAGPVCPCPRIDPGRPLFQARGIPTAGGVKRSRRGRP